MSRSAHALLLMIVGFLAVCPAAFAQTSKGAIQGRVADPSNAILQGAAVTVTPIGARAVTDTVGEYTSKTYPWPSQNVDYPLVQSYVQSHLQQFTVSGGPGPNSSQFDLTERVAAGYVMNSVDLSSRARLVAGVRVESTHVDTLSFNANTSRQDFAAGGHYVDVLPSASLKFTTAPNTAVRIVYSRALSRPDPQDITEAVGPVNDTQTPPTVSLGNPALKAEHANNYDVLLEQYLAPLGLIQAGYFYKSLSDPIIATQTRPTSGPYAGSLCRSRATPAAQRCRASRSRISSTSDFSPAP